MENKKRVLLVAANDLGNSGVPAVFMSIVRNLSDRYVFDIIITRENYYYRDEFLSFGGKIFLVKEREYKNKIKRIWWRLHAEKKFIKKEISLILRANKYDVIHSFKESESYIYLKEAKKFGIRTRIIHNNRRKEYSDSPLINYFINRSIKLSLKMSTHNISVSNECGKTFFSNTPFEVIYNCIDNKKFSFTQFTGSANDFSLLQVGTFLPIKNQIFSLEVVSLLKKIHPKIHCYFIGKISDSAYYNIFLTNLKKLNLTKNVTILDSNINQKEIMSNVSYSLVPSFNEGFSLSAIESQASGLMVFASTGIPKEVDIGNIKFLDLDANRWASEIDNYHLSHKNERKPVDASLFSIELFKQKVNKIYN